MISSEDQVCSSHESGHENTGYRGRIVCSGSFKLALFGCSSYESLPARGPAWDAVKLTLRPLPPGQEVGFICPFVGIDPTDSDYDLGPVRL